MSFLISDSFSIFEIADAYDRTTNRLNSFLLLQDGWHFGEGKAPSLETLRLAYNLNNAALLASWETDAFPGEGGEITLALRTPDAHYEVTIDDYQLVSLVKEVNNEEVQDLEEISFENAIEELGLNNESPCDISDLWIRYTGTPLKIASRQMLSKIRPSNLAEEFQSSSENALKEEASAFADIWPSSTPRLPSQLFSWRSNLPNYQFTT